MVAFAGCLALSARIHPMIVGRCSLLVGGWRVVCLGRWLFGWRPLFGWRFALRGRQSPLRGEARLRRARYAGLARSARPLSRRDTHLMCVYIGTLSVPIPTHATRPTAPYAPPTTPAPQFPSPHPACAGAGRCAPCARAAGLTRSHPSQGKDKWQEHRVDQGSGGRQSRSAWSKGPLGSGAVNGTFASVAALRTAHSRRSTTPKCRSRHHTCRESAVRGTKHMCRHTNTTSPTPCPSPFSPSPPAVFSSSPVAGFPSTFWPCWLVFAGWWDELGLIVA